MSYLNPERNETGAYPMTYLAESPRHSMEVSVRTYNCGEYTIIIKAADGAGNIGVLEHVQKSWLKSAYDGFLDAMGEAWEAAKNAANWFKDKLLEVIKLTIRTIFGNTLERIGQKAVNWIEDVQEGVVKTLSEICKFDNEILGDESLENTLSQFLLLGFTISGLKEQGEWIANKMQKIMNYIKPYKDIINPTKVMEFLLGYALGGNANSKMENLGETAASGLTSLLSPLLGEDGLFTPFLSKTIPMPLGFEVPTLSAWLMFLAEVVGTILGDSIRAFLLPIISAIRDMTSYGDSSRDPVSEHPVLALIVAIIFLAGGTAIGHLTFPGMAVGFATACNILDWAMLLYTFGYKQMAGESIGGFAGPVFVLSLITFIGASVGDIDNFAKTGIPTPNCLLSAIATFINVHLSAMILFAPS